MDGDENSWLRKLDVCTLKQLLADIDYHDQQVVDAIIAGFPITGVMATPGHRAVDGGLLRKGRNAKGLIPDVEELRNQCAEINEQTLKRLNDVHGKAQHDPENISEVWAKTVREQEEKKVGPFMNVEDIDLNKVLLTHRFGSVGEA